MFSSSSEAFGHSGRVFGLAFHPVYGHQVIASASEDETVRVWCRSEQTRTWEQTSCCRGHTAEVLRVAWSPDGRTLASGSADHTVRLWQVGLQDEQSYSGVEVAVLSGHPEEVYGLKYLQNPAPISSDVADTISNKLVTASGESLFLWDVQSGCLLHESAPVPPVTGLESLSITGAQQNSSSSTTAARNGPYTAAERQNGTAVTGEVAGLGSNEHHNQAHEQPQEEEAEQAAQGQRVMPSYIFGLAQAAGTNWFAAACCDGMLRLWDAGQGSLQEVAAVKVHPLDMGSVCSFVPGQPWLVLSISKSGELVLQDVRLLGHPLLLHDIAGPVYDMTWAVQAVQQQPTAAAAAGDDSNPTGELLLCVVGRDQCVRSYSFTRDALLQAHLPAPVAQPMPSGYTGRLLALAATVDGASIAAAGEAVAADILKPLEARQPQRRQQQHPQQQQVLEQKPQQLLATLQQQQPEGVSGAVVAAAAGPALAAAVSVTAAGGRRARNKSSAGRQAVDLFTMEAEGNNLQVPTGQLHQTPLQLLIQQQDPTAHAAAAVGGDDTAGSRHGERQDTSIKPNVAPTAAEVAESTVQYAPEEQIDQAGSAQSMPACAAAAAGVLLRAPLFISKSS